MSAQDDVLAAFGAAPERKPGGSSADQTAEAVSAQADSTAEASDRQPGDPAAPLTAATASSGDSQLSDEADETGTEPETGVATEGDSPDVAAAAPPSDKAHETGTEAESGVATEGDSPGDPAAATPSDETHETGTAAATGLSGAEASLATEDGAQVPTALPTAAPAGPSAAPIAQPQPPATGQLYLDPSAFFTELQAASAPKTKRRWPRLALRYVSALAVAGAVGAGTAYAVTIPRRTDVPFLATPNDGRYEFPGVTKPAPPPGKFAPGDERNAQQTHYGDLRRYLLPVPKGAVVKEDGWEPIAEFAAGIPSDTVPASLNDAGVRRIARRGWTAADGQHTVVELVQFPDHQAAYGLEKDLVDGAPKKFGRAEPVVPLVTLPVLGEATEDITLRVYDAVDGLPGQVARRAVFRSGDLVVIVTATAPKAVTDVAAIQVLTLQTAMLR